jgi:hypothetical protein
MYVYASKHTTDGDHRNMSLVVVTNDTTLVVITEDTTLMVIKIHVTGGNQTCHWW